MSRRGIVTFAASWGKRNYIALPYHGHRFPPVVIQHVVWLHLRLTLSLRDVEDMLAERGLDLSYETVRRWVCKFGPLFARDLRRRRPRPTARWHLDEMVITIAGKRHWLWRAVDDEGEVLDVLVQTRRDTRAAVSSPLATPACFAGCGGALRSCVSSSGSTTLRPRRSRPTGSVHTARPSDNSDCWLVMSADSAGITGPRTPTSRRVGENGRCVGSSRQGPHNAFCRPMLLSTTPSASNAISCPGQR